MKLVEILGLCEKEGIELSVKDGALRVVATRNKVSEALKSALRDNKLLLIAMLGGSGDAGYQAEDIVADARHLQAPQATSFAQRRIWLESTLADDKAIYNTRLAGTIRGELSADALEAALVTIVERHAILRTLYLADDGEPLQRVVAGHGFGLVRYDWSDRSLDAQADALRELADGEMHHRFDLARELPIRAHLVRCGQDQHELIITTHHIATDGWSTGLLFRELNALYGAYREGRTNPLPDLPIQYVDYAVWQRARLSGRPLEKLLDYWRERLADAPTLHALPLDHERPAQQSHRGRHHFQRLERDLTAKLEQLSSSLGLTMFVTLQSVFALLVARYTGTTDVVMGSANANRLEGAVQPLIGCFLNNLVLRTDLSRDQSVESFLQQQKRRFFDDFEHQHVPFELLVEQINPERSLAYHPLVQIMFGYENNDYSGTSSQALALERQGLQYEISKFDLSLHASPQDGGIEIGWGFAVDVFKGETIARMAASFETLLAAVVADPSRALSSLPLVADEERAELLALAEGPAPARASMLLPELVAQQAARRGDAPALVLDDEQWSYAQLAARANQIARTLLAAGVQRGDRVGVCQERTLDMLASVIGTMSAGAVYVPLDPGYPDERLAYLLEDAGISHVLTEAYLAAQLPLAGQRVVRVSDADDQDASALDSAITRDAIAYMIYTSGSTGQPKGVAISHGAYADKLAALAQHYELTENDRSLLFASMSFDASLSQLGAVLSVGGSVALRPDAVTEPEALLAYVTQQRVTWMHVVPAYLRQLVEVKGWEKTSLTRVTSGGDVLDAGLQQAWFTPERAGIALYNSYGPTEIAITSSSYRLRGDEAVAPIGRPLANTRYWVLDAQGGLLPRGAVGELCIGGSGLAAGYWKREAQTNERFVEVNLTGTPERVYRSGDRVRWNEDGQLEFVGRSDHQVKVRGYRIELGEIEAALQACNGVTGAVVKVEDDGLWAYVATSGDLSQVEVELASRLPGYLLPSGYERVTEWPLTRSGKIDRKALKRGAAVSVRREPNNPIEQALLEIWSALLKSDDIGVTDNFFQRGGHSLLATRLASQIRKRFEVDFTLKSLFELPSIEEQASLVLAQQAAAGSSVSRLPAIAPVGHEGPVALSYAQSRLWILSELENFSSAYNSSQAVAIEGLLDPAALEQALARLIQRHTVLRSVIGLVDGQPMQTVLPAPDFRLSRNDVSGLAPEAQDAAIAELARGSAAEPFDLTADLMLRACLVRRGPQHHVLVLTLHHIACDGWSLAVLIRELNTLYAQCVSGQADTRAPLPVQYRDYAQWQHRWLQGEVLERTRGYWLQRLAGAPEVHQLPLDRPRPAQPSYRGAVFRQRLPASLRQALEALAQRHQATLFMTVQAAFASLLSRFSGETDIVMGTAIANREQAEIGELIGLFANTLVLRTQVDTADSFSQLLQRSRPQLLADFAQQHMPFELLVEALNPTRQLSYNPLFQVMLLWQNNERAELQLGEGLRLEGYGLERAVSKFELTLTVQEDEGELALAWRYASDLFDEASVAGWARSFACLLEGVAAQPQRPLQQLSLLSADDRAQLTQDLAPLPAPECLHRRFEQQAARTPEAIALISGTQRWTYAQLDARADRLARRLRQQGVGADSVVGLCCERHGDLVVGLLGILKAGAAYLPLDPGYPAERLQYMVEDSGARWLVGDREHLVAWSDDSLAHVVLDSLDGVADAGEANRHVHAPAGDSGDAVDHLAYLIYTSGSTGRPKGVMVSHRAVSHFLDSAHVALDAPESYRWLAVTPVSFDISVLELFLPLCQGGTVVLAERADAQDAAALVRLLREHDISQLQATPVTWKLLREVGWNGEPGLQLLVGGEYVPDALGQWLADKGDGAWNCYGPTEATVWTHMHAFARDGRLMGEVSDLDGRLAHAKQCVVGRDGALAPAGGVGELWLGGAGLADGYWNRAELTEEKFVTADLLGGPQRWYRTGDWVQQRHDGGLRYLGRVDQQVKLRGHRIELGEVEQCLLALTAVADAVANVYQAAGREPQLVAYVVLAAGERWDEASWRAQLQAQLPGYMHPASVSVLEALPLTANGKIDRKALPAPMHEAAAEFIAPATPTEQHLAGLWAELLGLDTVSTGANFFELGGHSLLATRMINRLREAHGLHAELKQVFLHPTLRELARHLDAAAPATTGLPPLVHVDQTRTIASYAQTRLWFLERLRAVPGAYHINSLLRLDAAPDRAALERALAHLIQRHPALRTCFEFGDDGLFQVVQPASTAAISYVDLSALPEAEAAVQLEAACEEQKNRPIDLTCEHPFRARIVQTAAERAFVLLTFHHIACDGWSVELFVDELARLYTAIRTGADADLAPAPTLTYQDYSRWQRAWLHGEGLERSIDYWRTRLADAPAVHRLALDRPRPAQPSFQGGIHREVLDAATTTRLKALLHQHQASLFVGLKALFGVLLARYSGEKDIVLGTAVANRQHQALERVVGYFANTVVLRQRMADRQDFPSLLREARDSFLADYEHQHTPFELLVDALKPERQAAVNPLFQIMFVLQNLQSPATGGELGVFEAQEQARGHSPFDLTLAVREDQGGLVFAWRYATELFDASTIAKLSSALLRLVEQVVATPAADVHSLPILGADEIARELETWNDTACVFADGDCLAHELIERWAQRTPERAAVVFGGQVLSYGELNERADVLAQALRGAGVGADALVGLFMAPSLEMVIALLATLKAGAAYVPLDPAYPQARLRHMLDDSGARLLLTRAGGEPLPKGLHRAGLSVWPVDATGPIPPAPHVLPAVQQVSPDHLAYAIYTSGSTGLPKGVALHHRGLVNHVLSQSRLFGIGPDSRMLQFAALSFDVAACEIFLALCNGAQLHVIDEALKKHPDALSRYIHAQRLTHIMLIPSVLALLAPEAMASVESVIVGGESISVEQADFWSARHRLFNAYGPSEATICAVAEEYRGQGVAIGHPIDNMACYLLDAQGRLVPQGVPGELHLAGVGLARGYLNQPELTAARFIRHRFEDGTQRRLYRTGDLARRLPDGRLEFLGRTDSQVKIRGYRIETDEIANRLQRVEGVKACVVHAQPLAAGEKGLVAYVVGLVPLDDDRWPAFTQTLRDALAGSLPAYMLPAAYVQLDALPTLENGKVNRHALPLPDVSAAAVARRIEPPRTPTEHQLCADLSQVLGCESVSVADNFFQLGGNSILAMKLAARINASFGIALPLTDLFEAASLRELALRIDDLRAAGPGPVRPAIQPLATAVATAPLSYEQQRIWFLSEVDANVSAYNASWSLSIDGPLDATALEQALARLIQRHTVLRSVIGLVDGQPMQTVLPAPDFRLSRNDVSGLAPEAQDAAIAELARGSAAEPFDLTADLMLRACLVRRGPQHHVLVLTLHHIACDGWSLAVLIRELNTLYAQCVSGQADTRAPLPVQYRDYAQWQHRWLQGEVLERTRGYWLQRLAGAPEVHQLPLDRPRPAQPSYRGAVFRQRLPASLRQALEALAQRHQATLFMTVQAAFASLLSRFSGETDIVMGTAIANREQAEIGELIGLFANTLVLRTQVDTADSFSQLLQRSRPQLLADFAQQHMPFELLVEALNPTRQLSYNPLFQVMLLWQNNERAELQLGEGLRLEGYGLERAVSKFELTLTVQEDEGELALAWRYASDLFDEASVAGWARSFACLLEGVAAQPQRPLQQLSLLSADDRAQLTQDLAPLPAPECLHRRFEQQAARTPEAIALISGTQRWTYAQLDARADRLARRLRQQGVGADSVVGLCCERHGDLVVGLLGILKAGAAYLPLDPGYPAERLQYMVEDSGARWLVGDREHLVAWSDDSLAHVVLDSLDGVADAGEANRHVHAPAGDSGDAVDHLAYLIYTSGSTGRPKGVMVSHRAVSHFLDSAHVALDAPESYRWLAVTPVSFDISVLELFLPLCQGGTVVLAERADAQDAAALVRLLREHDISQLQATPVTWKLLREVGWNGEPGLQLLVGGEYVPESLGQWMAGKGAGVWNCYGPTEATVYTHLHAFARDGVLVGEISDLDGRLAHAKQRVVGRDGALAPPGGVGELWLGGAGLADGYWNRAELTEEKFVTADLLGGPQRWYRTGDWVQQRHDGGLRYLGRIDHQVKLRGHRIELGEVEQCLLALTAVADAVANVYQAAGREPQLVAYVVLAAGERWDEASWRAQLQAQLPGYMHPASVSVLEALPLTANGKIDRKALPPPTHELIEGFIAPATPTELRLADLWSELLGRQAVSASANFFELGGHSLLATRMIARLAEQLQVRIPIKVVFEYPTIAGLGGWIDVGRSLGNAPALAPSAAGHAPALDEVLI